jgi:hypothetical protein
VRGPEPLYYTGRVTDTEVTSGHPSGLIEWAPTWGGMFVSLGILMMLGALGVALSAGSGIWGAISAIIAFFAGGWLVGRSLNVIDTHVATMNGILMWAITLIFTLVFGVFTAILGANALASVAHAVGFGNLIGPIGIGVAVNAPSSPLAAAAAANAASAAAWGTFFSLLLTLAAAIGGAILGANSRIPSTTVHR